MNDTHYRALDALNYSGGKAILVSPAHYNARLNEERKDTPALKMGRLIHLATLQPYAFFETVHIEPEIDRRTTAGKAAYEEFKSKIKEGDETIDAKNHAIIVSISTSAQAAIASLGLKNIRTEVAVEGEFNGVKIKGRIDLIGEDAKGNLVVVDLKSCTAADPKSFSRDVASYMYHMQDAWYTALVKAKKFYIVAQEKDLPYAYRIYTLDEATKAEGVRLMTEATSIYAQCKAFNTWPSYTTEVTELSIPKWAFSTQP
jgi:hypothetical protein